MVDEGSLRSVRFGEAIGCDQEVMILAHLWFIFRSGIRLSLSLWPVALLTWLFQALLLIPLLIPLFSYLSHALPPLAALSVPGEPSAAGVSTALSLVAGSHPRDWDAMQISLYYDLLFPFSSTAAGKLWQNLQWIPFLLFALLRPFWQAGVWSSLRHRLVFPRHRKGLFRTFFEGVVCWGYASLQIALWLAPVWIGLWWLFDSLSNRFDAISWSPAASLLIAGLSIMVIADLLGLVGDAARWRLVMSPAGEKRRLLGLLRSTASGLTRHLAPLLLARFALNIIFLIALSLMLWSLQQWPAEGITGMTGAFLLQQTSVFLLIFSRLALMGATARYLQKTQT
ncbi:conserved hypothetical protein [Heliomicrobium modesticaldum Ice1]|uniref:Uncharacterized protein n=1 Tax=Heliobacterium modesticaldum (strain ATCC 51547 / Ice1) TaxID=498761 RepID=B0TF50_HELMI|nr:conserved hypothetical protein [Heliomicrobium modesticaldum Ice1]